MPSHTNKISDNGYIYKYNYKNSRKLLTFERDTTTISSEGNETKSWSLGRKTAYPPQSRSKGGTAFLFPNIKLHHLARKTGATAARGLASQCSLEFQNDQLRFLICNSGENGDTLLDMIRIFCKAQSCTNVRWTVRGQSADASNGHSMEHP